MIKPKYNHIKREFTQIVAEAFPKLDILSYYPYGPKTEWSYWLCGKVNLKKEYLDERNKNKTELELVFSIIEETARAMNYLMTHGNDHWFDRQRVKAFALWRLFHSGDQGWTKEPLKGLNEQQKKKLFYKGQKDGKLAHGRDKTDIKPKKDKESLKIEENWFKSCLKNYGVYEVRQLPLIKYSNTTDHPEILYTKQELCAISLMVTCAFENLC